MALTNQTAVYTPLPPIRWPDHSLIDPADMLIDYDQPSDSLAIAFGGRVQPATIDPIDGEAGDYVSLRIDLENGEDVVGIEIENVGMALDRHPTWRPVVEAAPTETQMSRVSPSVWPALAALVADVDRLSEQWPRVKPQN
ncbi:MAG: hypothetical protein ACRDJH_11380 [Thermomicrobiales bacterium]